MTRSLETSASTSKAYALFYVYFPTLTHGLLALLCIFFGENLAQQNWMFYTVAALTLVAALSGYMAYFDDRVSDLLALTSALLNGALTITVFAGLHRISGILCGSQVCSGTQLVEVSLLARISPPEIEETLCALTACVQIYTDLFTSFYFSTVTFTTLGYGDLQPVPDMRVLAGFEAVVGYVFLGFLVGAAFHWGTNTRNKEIECAHCDALLHAQQLRQDVEDLKDEIATKTDELTAIRREQARRQSQSVQPQEPDQGQG